MLNNSDIAKLPETLKSVVNSNQEDFFSSFLLSYGFPKSSIKKANDSMASSGQRKCSIKQKLLYTECSKGVDLEAVYFDLLEEVNRERFAFVTDFERIMAKDLMSGKGIDIAFEDLPDSYEFFLPWCGREIVELEVENPADVKAATEMSRLFEAIQTANKDNPLVDERAHNTFLTRILFCFYADDTGIFRKDQFRNSILQNTAEDGSDMKSFIKGLFEILDTNVQYRSDVHPAYKDYPYVNGGLFRERLPIPDFNRTARRKFLECSAVDWSVINPDIFGSMFQTVIDAGQRHALGQHYTSVTNIMKVLRPLFLDDLHLELDKILEAPKNAARDKKLNLFRNRLANISVFDPACGSGNFLIIAYKELCHLEMEAIENYSTPELPFLSIRLSNFHGIEIDDFPCEVARLALWIVQHQINMECYAKFGTSNPTLPLTSSGNIVCGNALRLNWDQVCPGFGNREIYVCGNPPYAGGSLLTATQKQERDEITDGIKNNGFLDYIACWFVRAAEYMEGRPLIKTAFVTTNSLNQGMQVTLWPWIFNKGLEISFAYESFKWKNNARDNAGVTVTIIGLETKSDCEKHIYSETTKKIVKHLNPYLTDGADLIVQSRHYPKEGYPVMCAGVKMADNGALILSTDEMKHFNLLNPNSTKFIKKLIGAEEYIKGKERWCLWVPSPKLSEACLVPEIKERLERCKSFRENSKVTGDAYKLKDRYWQPREFPDIERPSIILPSITSENRTYIPMGYLPENIVVTNRAFVIYDAPLWLFAILTSKMHMTWMKSVCGRLETRYSYNNTLCYNTFPFPSLTDAQKKALESSATTIIDIREEHYDMTMAQLYDPDTMPDDLKTAHEANDLLVDRLFRKTGFDSDEDRLAELFRLYEANTKGDN